MALQTISDSDATKILQGLAVVWPFVELRPNRLQDEQADTFRIWFREYVRLRQAGQSVQDALLGALEIKAPCPRRSSKAPWKWFNSLWC